MKFLLDESADARLRHFLQEQGHDVTRIAADFPAGLSDDEVLRIAYREGRILVVGDRGFGGLVFVQSQPPSGVIYLRLGNSVPIDVLNSRLAEVPQRHAHDLDAFLVVTSHLVRIRRDEDL